MSSTLRIVSVNDVYSLENLPRLASLVAHHRARAHDAFLVLLAGDFLAPSILSSLDAGRGMVDCLNAIGVTHVIFGNHEDDIPTVELRKRVAELSAKVIDTNVRTFDSSLPTFDVVRVGGTRVGLIGVVMADPTVYHRKPFGGSDVAEANATACAETARLLRDGLCDVVVPMTHQSIDDDRALARLQRDPPYAVIIGGHEHEVFEEQVEGTWIVKAGADAAHALVIDLAFTNEGNVTKTAIDVHLEDVKNYPEDAGVRARVNKHVSRVHEIEAATLLRLAPGATLSSVGTRLRQTTMGTLLCGKLRDTLGAEACLMNGGGIRAARDYEKHLTYADLKSEVPFDNEVVVAKLPGRAVREAVQASRAHAPMESGGFLQVDDRITVDEKNVVIAIAGAPLEPDREYRVAVVRDLFFGLDHIEPLIRFAQENPNAVPEAGSGREIKVVLVQAFSVALWRSLGGFDAVDTNHDGVVTEQELEAAIARANGEAPSKIAAELVLHAIDRDHDDRISKEEAKDPAAGGDA
jgi:2',3'-cyclic-nucleotide 2'-phosphodiesterase (5'-nucleotidase family)